MFSQDNFSSSDAEGAIPIRQKIEKHRNQRSKSPNPLVTTSPAVKRKVRDFSNYNQGSIETL
jgi:hypothetical protein